MNDTPSQPILAYLAFLRGPLAGKTYPITQTVVTIGRNSTNNVVIIDPKLSRFHARLSVQKGSWWIEKLSQNTTIKVEEESIQRAKLAPNSQIFLGENVSFLFLLTLTPDTTEDAEATLPRKEVQPPGATTAAAPPSEMGIPSLEVVDNTTGSSREYPLIQDVISIGRDQTNTIMLDEPYVSDFHVQLLHQDGQWILLHPHPLRSETAYGLLSSGQRTPGNQPLRQLMKHGDIFRIENNHGAMLTLKFKDGRADTHEFLPRMQVVPLEASDIRLGRSQENTILLNHPQVSAYHAQMLRDEAAETYRLIDLNSTNHTYVNGLVVTNQLLHHGDEIRIGAFKLIYGPSQLTLYDESGGIRVDVLGLKQVRSNRVLLNDISLSIPQRSFVALVGVSGAGKSTLLDALSGLRPAVEGAVFYNGQDYYEHIDAFRTQIGYVPQDEIIHRDLSVERALYYTARLRLPRDFTPEQIEQRINEVLDDVEMQHRRKNLVRQLSGGQRKRVSIALELLARPSIFFLDEPTSGLDPGLDRKMMILLRKLADKGHTIVLVTHATNNINVCDYVCFLAPGGNLAYFGPPDGAKTYFEQPDFAEIYSVLDAGEIGDASPEERAEEFQQSKVYQRYIEGPLRQRPNANTQLLRQKQKQGRSARRGSFWRQFRLLSLRYLELLKNDQINVAILLLQAPVIGLLLLIFIRGVGPDGFNPNNVVACPATVAIIAPAGFPDVPTPLNPITSTSCRRVEDFLTSSPAGQAYAQQRGGVAKALQDFIVPGPGYAPTILFIIAFSAVMFGCINAIREFVKEAPIYQRERAVNLGLLPYICSKIVVLGVLCLLQSAILVVCGHL